MTAIIDHDAPAARHEASNLGELRFYGAAAAPERRGSSKARGLSPRLSTMRTGVTTDDSTTESNGTDSPAVRTPVGPPRLVGARGSAAGSIERTRVRSVPRSPLRGASRVGGCARRTARPTVLVCALATFAAFAGLILLFSGPAGPAGQTDAASSPAAAQGASVPALTSLVTVRAGQDLVQIATEIAPNRPIPEVVQAISEINGIVDGTVRPGQTLVTPRY